MSGQVHDLAAHRRQRDGMEALLSKRDLAGVLGFSVRWVEYRVAEGMPCKRLGGRLRFQRTTVERWLENRDQEAS